MKNFINKYTISIVLLLLTTLLITKYYQSSQVPQQPTAFSGKVIPLNYTNSILLNTFNKKNIDEYQTAAGTYDIQTIASEITSTMITAFSNSIKRTLPLVASWNVGIPEYSDGLDPLYLINRFTYGEHLVPTWKLDPYYNDSIGLSYYEASIKKAAELELPLVFILPSPESALTKDDVYFSMDKTQNPNVITVNGTVLPELSPFGPDNLWKEIGAQWSTTTLMAQLQEWYPNPPLVVFIDEDSSKKLSWSKLATSSRYIKQYPTNTSNEFKRTLVNAKWLEKYRQLHEGFKQGFIQNAWKQNVKFVTRNQLALNMGVTSDWINSTTTTNQYANIWPLTADGLSINFDLSNNKTDITNAPHTLLNNLPFMLEEAKTVNPNFTYQLNINANQQIDNPQRYRGFTQFALWLLRPSIIRQKPNNITKDEINPLFQQIIDSVELTYNNDVLSDFWKNGKLVSTGTSTYNQNILTRYKSIPREFLLKTDAASTVWAFALEKNVTPNREWLIYIQSPEHNLTNIIVTIPKFQKINFDATQKGNFYLLKENATKRIITTNMDKNDSSLTNSFKSLINPFVDISAIYESKFINNTVKGHGTTYYINSIDGNDENNGLSVTQAWKSVQNLSKIILKQGDTVLFKRGMKYEGQLLLKNIEGIPSNPITIGAYGEGLSPVITTLEKQSNIWNKTNSLLWETTITSSIKPERIFLNNSEILRADDINQLEKDEKYKWYYNSEKQSLYIKSESDINNEEIYFSTTSSSLRINNSKNIVIQDLDIQSGYSSLIISGGDNIKIINNIIGAYASNGVTLTGRTYNLSNVTIINNIIDSKFTLDYRDSKNTTKGHIEGLQIFANSHNIAINTNIIKNWGHTSINIFARKPFDTSENYDIEIKNNFITAPDIAYGGRIDIDGNSHNIEIFNNFIKNISARNQINGHKNHFHDNIIDTVRNSPIKTAPFGQGIMLQSYYSPVYDNEINNNLIMNTEAEGFLINHLLINGDIYHNKIHDNIFYKCNKSNIAINIQKPSDLYNFKEYNNVIYNNMIFAKMPSNTFKEYDQNIFDQFNIVDENNNSNKSLLDFNEQLKSFRILP